MSNQTPANRMEKVKQLISEADAPESIKPEPADAVEPEPEDESELETPSEDEPEPDLTDEDDAEPDDLDEGDEGDEPDEGDDALLLTFEEMVVDRLLESDGAVEMVPMLIEEMALWIEITEDPAMLDRAAQVIAATSDGLQILVQMLAEKLSEE